MNESEFENELRQFHPAAGSDAPRRAIARAVEGPSPIADRILASFVTSGAAAAVLLVTLNAIDFIQRPSIAPGAPQAAMQSTQQSLAQRQELLGELARDNTLAFNR